jgi:hypothetical protein
MISGYGLMYATAGNPPQAVMDQAVGEPAALCGYEIEFHVKFGVLDRRGK